MKSPIEGLQIPQHWQIAPISRLADFRRGISWRKQDESPPGEGTLVVSIPNIKDGWIDYQSKFNHYIGVDIPESKLLSEGDVVFVGSSGSIHNVGRNARISQATENSIAFASFTFRARPDPSVVDSHFFYFLVNSDLVPFQAFCKRAADGKFNFQLGDFSSRLVVPLPPLAEQKAIARDLAAVKRAIEAQERIIQTTTELKQALMQKLFSEGLRGEPQKETEIGLVPESWEVVEIGDVIRFTSGKTKPRDTGPKPSDERTVPVYGGNGILGYSAEKLLDEEALILGRVGEYCGCAHLTPRVSWVTDNALYANEEKRKTNRTYIRTHFEHLNLNQYRNKMGQPLITQGIINKVKFGLPQAEEQDELAHTFETLDGRIAQAQAKRDLLQELFRTLLHELMTAKSCVYDLELTA